MRDRPHDKRVVRLLIAVAIVAAIYLVARSTGLFDQLDADSLARRMRASGTTGVALFVAAFCVGLLAQVPGTPFVIAAVGVYGAGAGTMLSVVGAYIACTFSFAVVRLTGRWVLARRSLALFSKYAPYVEGQPLRAVIFLRAVFGASPPVNWALALTSIGTRDFLVGTAIGLVPNVVLYCWLIHQIAFDEQPALPRWAVGLLIVLVIAAGTAAHRSMMRRFAPPQDAG